MQEICRRAKARLGRRKTDHRSAFRGLNRPGDTVDFCRSRAMGSEKHPSPIGRKRCVVVKSGTWSEGLRVASIRIGNKNICVVGRAAAKRDRVLRLRLPVCETNRGLKPQDPQKDQTIQNSFLAAIAFDNKGCHLFRQSEFALGRVHVQIFPCKKS